LEQGKEQVRRLHFGHLYFAGDSPHWPQRSVFPAAEALSFSSLVASTTIFGERWEIAMN
jgi:hypothetical protein